MFLKKLFIFFIALVSLSISEGSKYAIVVGINDYDPNPLRMCVNDANAMSSILDEMGYKVTKLLNQDATASNIRHAIYDLNDKYRIDEDDTVLFYFSGHGSGEDGEHYLIPAQFSPRDKRDLGYEAVVVSDVQNKLEKSGAGTRVMIIDACRTDYFKDRSGIGFKSSDNKKLYEHIIEDSLNWSNNKNTMYVVGANRTSELKNIREIIPDHFLLIPGVGTQGGKLKDISFNSMNENCGIIVNVSRDIIYSDNSDLFEENVRERAKEYKNEMESILIQKGLV